MKRLFILLTILVSFSASIAQYAGNIPLNTATAFFVSDSSDDLSGHHVTIVPDLNGDGYDEILVAAPQRDIDGGPNHGEVYLFYGRSVGFTGTINLSLADAVFYGEFAGNEASHDAYGIGDIDDDGYNDLAIAIKKTQNSQGGSRLGKVYFFFGGPTKKSGRISLEAADASLVGDVPTAEAAHIKGVGDINGDGKDDIIIGAGFDTTVGASAGKVYVFFGKSRGLWGKNAVMEDECNASYLAEAEGDWAGHRVSSVGDINGDGYNDFIVGADKHSVGESLNVGAVYLILGKGSGWSKNVSLANADASWIGAFKNDNLGWGVGNNIKDIDGDGKTDIIFNTRRSKYYIVLGKNIVLARNQITNDVADVILTHSTNVWDNIGHDVSSAGDLNGDGFDDFIIGNSSASVNGTTEAGKVFLFYGKTNWPQNVSMDAADAIFTGEAANDGAGFSVSGGGDVNGDGAPDLLISAWKNDDGATDAGKTYLFQTQPLAFKLIAPNGGETYYVNQTTTIRWVQMPDISQVKIEYSLNNGSSWTTIAASAPNTGSYQWTLPSQTSTQALVRIQDAADGDPIDTSDNVFQISDATGLTVTRPNGGEYFLIGNNHTIEWTAFNTSGQVLIEASRDSGATWETVAASAPDNGSFNWNVTGPTSAKALVRISDVDGAPSDVSDSTFSIIDMPMLTVVSPNGGEIYSVADQVEIQWTSQNTSGKVKIEISRDGGKTYRRIANDYEDVGSWTWIAEAPVSDQCLIRISDMAGLVSDVSDDFFAITATPTIAVKAPNGGEEWDLGTTQNIEWSATSVIENVKIELSRNNGGSWETLAGSTPNNGMFPWTVNGPTTQNALVRINEILAPYKLTLALTNDHSTPYEDEDWSNVIDNDVQGWDGTLTDGSGNSYAVFSFLDGNAKVISKIRLITDTGVGYSERWVKEFEIQTSMTPDNFQTVLARTKSGGGWEEFTFNPVTAKYVKIILKTPAGGFKQLGEFEVYGHPENPASDVSDAVFSISSNVNLTVTAPNGGEVWYTGTSQNITWNSSNGGPNVNIELSRDNGSTWTSLVQGTENDGVWSYNVSGSVSQICLVRITDPTGGVSDVSDAVFEINLPPAVTVTSPNGGEVFDIGDVYPITWTSQNTSGAVKIQVSRNNGATWGTIADSTEDDGQFDWTVGGPSSQNCLIKVMDYGGAAEDQSDAVFIIQVKPSITVLTPNGGETVNAGSVLGITWISANAGGVVNIEVSRDNGASWETIISNKNDNGKYSWTVTEPVTNNALIRVSAPGGTPSDVSDGVFTILATPTITVVEPNGGEVLTIGDGYNILWSNTNFNNDVKIEISRDGGSSWETITDSTENDGDYKWDIVGPPSTNCLVRVSDLAGGPSDVSDAVFTVQEPPSITVTAPNGGETFYIGAVQPIRWNSVNVSGQVTVELSRDGGANWQTLAEAIADTGRYDWTVGGPESDNCLVRVTDADGDPGDVSDAAFTVILEPAIVVNQPNGGEVWYKGTTQNIQWSTVNGSGTVKVELSRDNGQSWEVLADAMPDSGNLNWMVAGDTSSVCLIKLSDESAGLSDQSNSPFAIEEFPVLTIETPNGGELFYLGDTLEVAWSSVNTSGKVKVELSRDGGSTWTALAEEAEDNGMLQWVVSGDTSSMCLVRVMDVDQSPADTSDAVFAIELMPVITVTSPNGGERYFIGDTVAVSWTSVNTSGMVNVELSRDSGATWTLLQSDTDDDGEFRWAAEGDTSSNCLVRVTDTDGSPMDMSDSTFTIELQPGLTVLAPNGGEILTIDAADTIRWASVNTSGQVKIELSRDGNVTWEVLVDATADDGAFEWTVSAPASDSCFIRISDVSGAPMDTSDSLFVIQEAPSITVTSPNGGEMLEIGKEVSFTWNSINSGEQVFIELSRDAGSTWELLSEQAENSGSWSWFVEGPASDSCLVKVSSLDSTVSDVSDSLFQIYLAPVITVESPNGGDVWEVGADVQVTWSANYSDGMANILLSRNNGVSWEILAQEVPVSQGSMTVKASEPISDSCLVKIEDMGNGVMDTSDDLFAIKYPTGVLRTSDAIPTEFALKQNYPNPFNPTTRIAYQLPKQVNVELSIYNLRGELVRVLVSGTQPAGMYEAIWDGRNQSGNLASSGIYFYRISAGEFSRIKRLTFIK